jgi:nucleotide-binding universal stress UspA family protein
MVSADGVIRLRRILLPVDHQPDSREALMRAVRAAEEFREETVEIELMHANGGDLPRLPRPENPACTWKELRCPGEPVKAIIEAAQKADLIIVATEGRHGVFDAFRGSVTERVVRGAPCPVLAVPQRVRDRRSRQVSE